MICQIDDLANLGHCSLQNSFNPLFESKIRRIASLTSPIKSQIKNVTFNIHNSHRTAVFSDTGIDLCVNQVLDFLFCISPDEHHFFVNFVRGQSLG